MKQLSISCLFFCVLNLGVYAKNKEVKQQVDSVSYYSNLANNPKNNESLVRSYVFFKKEFIKNIGLKDTISAINNLRQLAIIQFSLGDYYGSETNNVHALEFLEKINDKNFSSESKVGIYNQLGRVYYNLLEYDEAIKYYKKALKYTKNQNYINIIKNNIGLIYIDKLEYQKAEAAFLNIYQNSLPLNDKYQTARALNNLGFTQLKLKKPEALNNLKKALELRLEIKDAIGLYSSYKNLSIFYNENGAIKKARLYAKKAYEIAKTLNSPSFLENALASLISLSPDPMVLEYQKLKDSLDKAKQIAENKYALIKFNYSKQEKIANENKLKQEQERADKIMYQALGGLIFISSMFTFLIIQARHKKDKIKIAYNTEARISKKVHDELANDIYQVMTKLQSNSNIREDMLDDLELIYSKTRDISKANSPINVNYNFDDLLKDLFASYNTQSVNVITKGLSTIDWSTLDDIKKITLYRVLQELLVNMKKHSFCTSAVISFKKINKKISISYADNGKGCVIKKGSGLRNMENRINSINGTIIFESETNKGFKSKITI
ncbi:hypothetical protein BWZ22_13085 [Seonamhaeicola sp. S2-3]|uniref:tetratricopeptide repeat-containing sensor histidine kinase n=1 Tax=Seonamhaeicola sp. S2-3 TaxID=1936081 RepID=UPI000972B7AD|nr:tetratricopeptide repeat-containing sensor histidine kinase [Seonamhaeicola sp. S2-3]APY12107.1 hypothetical protein BWZ22_13085 [Seonamhaeicola sp. S2-3]